MNNINTYILSLLSIEGKFSCLKSAENIEKVSHDKLTRFLSIFYEKPEIDIKSLPKGGKILIEECEARILKVQKNHISLCMEAYLFLKKILTKA